MVGVRSAVRAVVANCWVACSLELIKGFGGVNWGEGREEEGKRRGREEQRRERGGTGITLVGIGFQLALCDFEVGLVGHLVECVFAAGEELACVAVTVDMCIFALAMGFPLNRCRKVVCL